MRKICGASRDEWQNAINEVLGDPSEGADKKWWARSCERLLDRIERLEGKPADPPTEDDDG